MELIPSNTRIDFLAPSRLCAIVSTSLIVLTVLFFFIWGFNLGIDFEGGTVFEVKLEQPSDQEPIGTGALRSALADLGHPNAEVVRFGSPSEGSFRISLQESEEEGVKPATTASARAGLPALSAGEIEPTAAPVQAVSDAAPSQDGSSTAADPAASAEQDAAGNEAAVVPSGGTSSDAEKPKPVAEPPMNGEASPIVPSEDEPPAAASQAEAPEPAGTGIDLASNSLVIQILSGLEQKLGVPVTTERIESIGPRVGRELTIAGVESLALVGLLILAYIWIRFDARYAPGAVLALLHDVTITAGVFIIFQLEFNLQVLAALLVVLGYSLNDTIVIYDRIRENIELRGVTHLRDVINQSINQTLSRTLLTSLTTLMVVIALLLLGGAVIFDFALALFIGIIVGTYSTIYIASALLLYIDQRWKPRTA